MIMGRKTFESLPGLLPGRRHIVLTRDTEWQEDGAEIAASLDDALRLANAPHVAVIGGAEIYRLFADRADTVELTEVHLSPQGDTVIEAYGPSEWQEIARERHEATDGKPAYSFVTLKRKQP